MPAPARRALVPAGLIVPLLATACLGSGTKAAYADVALKSSNVSYDSKSNRVNFIIAADYTSNDKRPVEGIVNIYLDGRLLVSQRGILNPEKGTDFIVQADLPPGNYNFRIQLDAPGIKEDNYGNNIREVVLNATPTPEKPTPTVAPSPTAEATKVVPTSTPVVIATPDLEDKVTATPEIVGPYKLYCPTCTEKELKDFNSAFDKAWEIVKDVYRRDPQDQIVISINGHKNSYNMSLRKNIVISEGTLNTPRYDTFTYPISDFLADQIKERGVKHELAHRFNQSLFPTKNNIEPWYNTFDEGSAEYASGEIEAAKPTSTVLREDDGSLKSYNWMAAIELLVLNPNKFWEREDFSGNAGHLTGQVLYLLLEREGLTPEKNVVATKKLAEYYKEPGAKTNKEMIQSAYEFALGKNLNYLFNDWLQPGIKRFYPTATPTPTSR